MLLVEAGRQTGRMIAVTVSQSLPLLEVVVPVGAIAMSPPTMPFWIDAI